MIEVNRNDFDLKGCFANANKQIAQPVACGINPSTISKRNRVRNWVIFKTCLSVDSNS